MTQEEELFLGVIKNDFAAFAAKFFSLINPHATFKPPWHLEAIAAIAERMRQPRSLRQTVAMPPRCLKSYCFSVALPAFLLGHNPSEQIVCVSYGDELIETFSSGSRKIMEDPLYRLLFPDAVLSKVTQRELRTTKGGRRYCTTIGGAMTGLGGNVFIVDDPLNAINAFSEPINKQVHDFFDKTLSSRPNDPATARFLIVMQRLHEADLIGHVLERGGWEELKLQARATEEMDVDIGNGRVHHVMPGDLLHAERLPEVELARLLAAQGSATFEAQYQQNPLPAAGNQIKREWLQRYQALPPREGGIIVQSWDTAQKTAAANDWSACTTWLLIDRVSYLLDVWRGKLEFPPLKAKVAELYYQHGCTHLLIEDQGSGQSLIQDLQAGSRFNINPRKTALPKTARVDQASGAIEGGRVLFPQDAPWWPDFERELLAFPNGKHDDQVDSMTQYVMWMNERVQQGGFSYSFLDDEPIDAQSIAFHYRTIRGLR